MKMQFRPKISKGMAGLLILWVIIAVYPLALAVRADGPARELVFIDAAVEDAVTLAAAAKPGVETVMLDPRGDELAQIEDALRGRRGLKALHLVSHGAPGAILLGRCRVDAAALANADLNGWRTALTAGGDILLYGCDIAAGAAGRRFISDLAALTGADVSASTDATGAAKLGGDWNLEYRNGITETSVCFGNPSKFGGLLAQQTINLAGPVTAGSLSSGVFTIGGVSFTVTSASGFTVTQGDGGLYIEETSADGDFQVVITDASGESQFHFVSLYINNLSTGGLSGFGAQLSLGEFGYKDGTYTSVTSSVIEGENTIDLSSYLDTCTGLTLMDLELSGAAEKTKVLLKNLIVDLDATTPSVASITRYNPATSPTDADSLTWQVTFSEAVQHVSAGDFSVSGTTATATSVAAVNAAVYNVTVSGGDLASLEGTVYLNISSGNDITGSTGIALGGTTPTGANNNFYAVSNCTVPTLTATGHNPSFTEGGSAVDLFGTVSAATNDGGQTFSEMTLTVSNVADGGHEIFSIDGVVIALTDANTGSLTGGGNFHVGISASTATVSLYNMTRTDLAMGALIDGIAYSDTSENPTAGSRVVTITGITDSGIANYSAAPGVTSTVTVAGVNDAPANTVPVAQSTSEDTALIFSSANGNAVSVADADAASLTVTLAAANGALTLAGTGGLTFAAGDGTSDATMTFSGTAANINAALGGLIYAPAVDYFGSAMLTITTSDGSLEDTDPVSITVAAVNDAPVNAVPGAQSASEDTALAFSAANANAISIADVDTSGDMTITLTVTNGTLTLSGTNDLTFAAGDGTSDATMTFTGTAADVNAALNGLVYTPTVDYNGGAALSIAAFDGELSDTDTVNITVTAVNDAPVSTVPAAQSVSEDAVLTFSTANANAISITDDDASLTVTLTVPNGALTLAGTGGLTFATGDGTSDATMTFTGTAANVNTALDGLTYVPADYGSVTLTIITSDGLLSDADTVSITVIPINPAVTKVSSSAANGSYKAGTTITLTVTFDQTVYVSGGTPTLLLETGTADRDATYISGSGGQILTFRYTIQAGDTSADLDYAGIDALALNGATIRNVDDLDALLTLPAAGGSNSISGQKDIVVDTTQPAISAVSAPAGGTYPAGQSLDFTVTFTEAVTVTTTGGIPYILITLDGETAGAEYVSGSTTTALLFRYTVSPGDLDADGIGVAGAITANNGTLTDAAGNEAVLAFTSPGAGGVKVDGILPSLIAVAVASNNSDTSRAKTGDRITLSLTASEGINAPAVTIAGNPATVNDAGDADAGTWQATYTMQGTETEGEITFSIGYSDLAGNSGMAAGTTTDGGSVTYDRTNPTAIVTYSRNPAKAGDSLTITVTFSETLADTPIVQIAVSGAETIAAENMAKVSPTQYTYTHTVGGGDGTATVTLGNGTDQAGNAVTAAPASGATYTIDNTAPGVPVIIAPASQPAAAWHDGYLNASEVAGGKLLRVALPASGNAVGDILYVNSDGSQIGSALLDGTDIANGYADVTLTAAILSGLTEATHTLTASLADSLGNAGSGSAGVTVIVDKTAPAAALAYSSNIVKSGDSLNITANFSEALADNPVVQIAIGGAEIIAAANMTKVSATQYTYTYTVGSGNGTATVTFGTGTDLAGNLITAAPAGGATYHVDNAAPAISSVAGPAAGTYTVGQNLDFTVTYDEAVTVNTGSGMPRLSLMIGSTTVNAVYFSGTGTNQLVFRYTIGVGDRDLDGIEVSPAITLNGGTIEDRAGNTAGLSFTRPDTSNVNVVMVTVSDSSLTATIVGNILSIALDSAYYDYLQIYLNGTQYNTDYDVTGTGNLNVILPATAGAYSITIVLYDQAGNSETFSGYLYSVRPQYIPGAGDGFGWEMWKN